MTLKSKLGKRYASKARNNALQNETIALLSLEEKETVWTSYFRIKELEKVRLTDTWSLFPAYLTVYHLETEITGDSFSEEKALLSFRQCFLSQEEVDIELEYQRILATLERE